MLRSQASRLRTPVVLAAVLGALALPGSALGATASESGGTLVFQAGGGEQNNVFIGADGGAFRVTDSGAPVTAGAACTQRSVHRVSCPTAGITLVQVLTADSDDSVIALIGSVDADLRGGSGADYLSSADGDDTLSTGKTPPGGFEQLFAGGGNDILLGSPSTTGNTSMQAGAGDDELLGGANPDGLFGDLGADVLHGEGGSDSVSWGGLAGVTVTAGAGANDGEPGEGDDVAADIESYYLTYYADTVTGGSLSESFYGFSGNDVLNAKGGDDYVDGGDNADTLSGDGGNDTLQGGKRADDIVGGGGVDVAEYYDHASGVNVTINDVANDGGSGGAEGDNVHTDVEELRGTAFPDTLIGSAADNTIIGQAGNDNVQGAGGDDELFGDVPYTSSTTGNDDLGGGDGDDNLIGGNGADDFAGGPDYDFADYGRIGSSPDVTVSIDNVADDGTGGGAEGDNVRDTVEGVIGGSGNDTLTGNPFANTLFGGFGADELHGGAGNDLLDGETPGACCSGFSGDVLDGGTDKDTASYRSHTYNAVQVDIGGSPDGAFAGTEGDNVMSTVENLVGSPDGSDILTGNDQPNSISGRGGNDTLVGGGAADHLSGDFGSDTHEGQGGKDEINSFGDSTTDVDNCGTEADTAIADAFDTVNADCENVIP